MADGREPGYQEKYLKEEAKEESKEEKRNKDWWKIDWQKSLDYNQWSRDLRRALPEEQIPSQTCMARRHVGPGPTQPTPSRRDRWLREQILQAEGLQEQLEWRIRGVRQTVKELQKRNQGIWRELHYTRDQKGDYTSWTNYRYDQEKRWGEPSRVRRLGDSKRWRKHL
nr:rev [Equine infectious anemia virus]